MLPVRCQPVLPVEVVFGRELTQALPFPLGEPDVLLTYSGTVAIYQAFLALGLAPGSTVLCPSYNCGHEIEPLLRLGLRVECFRVTADLQVDLDDVAKRLTAGAAAVVVTHYFGFAQPLAELRELCDRHGAFLVEDCAHALFSNNADGNLGRVGDVAVYSMRKTLPIPNGGAVICNNRALRADTALTPPPYLTTWLKSLDLTAKYVWDRFSAERAWRDLLRLSVLLPLVAGSRAVRALHPRAARNGYNPDDDNLEFSIDIMSWGMSGFSARIMQRLDWSEIVGKRQANYRHLVRTLAGIDQCRLLQSSLPDWTCPLYLPVRVERPIDVYYKLAARRIFADVFWEQRHPSVDWERFPEARDLKAHVLVLPVHQDVSARQLEHVIAVLHDGQ